MSTLSQLEKQIGDLYKSAPALPADAKKSLVNAWPWIALVFGIIQILVAMGLWGTITAAERAINVANVYSAIYAGNVIDLTGLEKTVIYASIAVLVVDAVILLKAYPHLKKHAKRGWDLLFLGSLINVAYAVMSVFIDGRGVPTLIFSLLGSAIGFYLLFQVKSSYHTTK